MKALAKELKMHIWLFLRLDLKTFAITATHTEAFTLNVATWLCWAGLCKSRALWCFGRFTNIHKKLQITFTHILHCR